MNWNSVCREVCGILLVILNSKNFEITLWLISYSEVEHVKTAATNQI